jgi:hypothetical protein
MVSVYSSNFLSRPVIDRPTDILTAWTGSYDLTPAVSIESVHGNITAYLGSGPRESVRPIAEPSGFSYNFAGRGLPIL